MIGGPGPRLIRSLLRGARPRSRPPASPATVDGDPAELARAKARARRAAGVRRRRAAVRARRGLVIAVLIGLGALLAVVVLLALLE